MYQWRRRILHVEIANESYPPRASRSDTALMTPLTLSCSLSHQTHLSRLVLLTSVAKLHILVALPACEFRHWDLRWISLWGHETLLGAGDACEFRHWDLRWSSLWSHETMHWAQETHASSATGTFGGAPYGATKRCPGRKRRMRVPPLGPSVELPMGPRNAVLGAGDGGSGALSTATSKVGPFG